MTTYTSRLKLTLPGDGEFDGTWGSVVNTEITSLIDDAIAGYVQVTVSDSADTTLTVENGLPSQSRNMIISLRGTVTSTRNVICPSVSKVYVVKNDTVSNSPVIFRTSGGTGVSVPNGATMLLMCDGTDVFNAVSTFGGADSAVGSFTNLSYSGNFTGAASPSTFSIGNGEFFKSSNGWVGIGTTFPASKLHIIDSGDNKFATVLVENATGASGAGSAVCLSTFSSTWYLKTFAQQNTTQGGKFTVSSVETAKTVLSLDKDGTVSLPTGGLQANGFATTPPVTIAFSAASMVINCALSNVFNLVMTASMSAAPLYLNPQDGQTISIFITQDSVGSRTIIWGDKVKWPGGVAGVLSTAASSVDLVVLSYRAFTGLWYATLSKGFV